MTRAHAAAWGLKPLWQWPTTYLTAPIVGVVVNLFVGIALGATVVIANAIGRGDRDDVTRGVRTSIAFALLAGVGMTIVGEIIAEPSCAC